MINTRGGSRAAATPKMECFVMRNTDKLTYGKYKLSLEIPKPNQSTFRTRGLRSYGQKIMECFTLPYENFRKIK